MGISNQAPSDAGPDDAEPAAKRRRRQGATYKIFILYNMFLLPRFKIFIEPPRYDALLCIHEQAIRAGNLISLQCAFQR